MLSDDCWRFKPYAWILRRRALGQGKLNMSENMGTASRATVLERRLTISIVEITSSGVTFRMAIAPILGRMALSEISPPFRNRPGRAAHLYFVLKSGLWPAALQALPELREAIELEVRR